MSSHCGAPAADITPVSRSWPTPRPTIEPHAASTTLSVRSWRTSRGAPAPTEMRICISRARDTPRASRRLPRLPQATARISSASAPVIATTGSTLDGGATPVPRPDPPPRPGRPPASLTRRSRSQTSAGCRRRRVTSSDSISDSTAPAVVSARMRPHIRTPSSSAKLVRRRLPATTCGCRISGIQTSGSSSVNPPNLCEATPTITADRWLSVNTRPTIAGSRANWRDQKGSLITTAGGASSRSSSEVSRRPSCALAPSSLKRFVVTNCALTRWVVPSSESRAGATARTADSVVA